jgi:hypothetical protein
MTAEETYEAYRTALERYTAAYEHLERVRGPVEPLNGRPVPIMSAEERDALEAFMEAEAEYLPARDAYYALT